jgi:hypothetical protein
VPERDLDPVAAAHARLVDAGLTLHDHTFQSDRRARFMSRLLFSRGGVPVEVPRPLRLQPPGEYFTGTDFNTPGLA